MTRLTRLRAIGRPAGDSGETLIELLVSIVIMGIAGAAIIGSLLVAVDVSQLHQQQVEAQRYLRSWAEAVSNTNDATYPGCESACFVGMAPAAVGGLTPTVEGIACWNGAADPPAFVSCAASPLKDVRRVTLKVAVGGSLLPSAARSLEVVVRRPCAAGSSC